jgi:hypothetical protein
MPQLSALPVKRQNLRMSGAKVHEMQRRDGSKRAHGGHTETTALRRRTPFVRCAKKRSTARSDARRGRVLQAVVERTDFRRTLSILNTYAPRAMKTKATIARTARTVKCNMR